MLGRAAGLSLDHLADLGQREAELLALEDEREPVAVGTAEDSPSAVAPWIEETAALVESQSAVGERELVAEIVDAEFALVAGRSLTGFAVDPEDVLERGHVRGVVRVHGVAFRKNVGKSWIAPAFGTCLIDVAAIGEKFAVKWPE